MKFAGKAWKLLVGIKDALVLLLMLMFFGGLYAALSASPYGDSAARGALRLDLAGAIVEQPAEQDPLALLGGPLAREYRLSEVIHALDTAATDERIEAVALDLDIFTGGGQTALANVGEALDRVRRANKRVVAYATGYSDDSYQLAAHADEVWLDPMGAVLIAGPGGSNLYYAGLLERLGVTANVYRVGTFKSAVEPYTRNDMSPEARQASQALADALWGTWRQDVGQARPRARIDAYVADPAGFIAAADGDMAQAALRAGLIDRIGDRAAFGQRMAELAGAGEANVPGSYRAVHYDAWADEHPAGASNGQIGVLTVAGEIIDGEGAPGTAGAETVVRNLERGLERGTLRALVVRVDSPGGSVLASERIRRAVLGARARGLPVVISMGSVAASGGYWIATAGDTILAEPSTITGSIGVFGILPSFEGTLRRLGIGADGVRTTPLSGEPDLLRGPSPEADRLIQMGVEGTYRRFVSLVSRARRIAPARVDEIAQGRVWDGGTARQLGLVDRFGSLDDAIAEAARRAEIGPGDARPVFLEQEPGFVAQLLRDMARGDEEQASRDVFARLARRPQAMIERALHDAQAMLAGPAIQVALPRMPGGRAGTTRARFGFAVGAAHRGGLAGVKIRRATADDAAALASIYAPYVTASVVSFEAEPPDAAGNAPADRGGRRSLPLVHRLRGGRAGARLCLCVGLPRPPGLPVHGRNQRLCRRRRAPARRRYRALPGPARGAGGAGLRPGDRRDHPAQPGEHHPARSARLRPCRDLRAGRLQVRRMAQRRPVAARAGADVRSPRRAGPRLGGLEGLAARRFGRPDRGPVERAGGEAAVQPLQRDAIAVAEEAEELPAGRAVGIAGAAQADARAPRPGRLQLQEMGDPPEGVEMGEAVRRLGGAEDERPAGEDGGEMLADRAGIARARTGRIARLQRVAVDHPRRRHRPGAPAFGRGDRGPDVRLRRLDDDFMDQGERSVRLAAVGHRDILRRRGHRQDQQEKAEEKPHRLCLRIGTAPIVD